jgi:tetratricopeptide (TPR) repeat protein
VHWVSTAVAAAWLLHPFNLTSVLYAVQRMTSLSAFFSIWGLVIFVWGRTRLYEGRKGILPILVSLLLLTPLAALSKEIGALLPAFMLVVEVSLFTFHAEQLSARRFLIGFYGLFVAIPAAFALIYVATHFDGLLASYKTRDFTLSERIMTEARVLWFYIWQILLPSTAQMGLYHDDIAISRGLFQPVSTALSLIGLMALLGLSWISRKRAPLITLGVLFFLTGHVLESTMWPLEIAHEHRNYLPMVGILLSLLFYLLYPLKYIDTLRLRQMVTVLLIGLFAFNTFSRADKWGNPYDLFQAEVEHHPNSAIVNGEIGAIYSNMFTPDQNGMEAYYNSARQYFEKAVSLDKNDTKPLFGLIFINSNRHKTVESGWVDTLKTRLEHAPYAAVTSDKLVTLTRCQLEGNCKLSNIEFESLLQAALRNPTLIGSNRAKVLYAQSSYLINVAHDYPVALDVMHQMIQTAPPQEIEYRFALINFLTALQRFDEAKAELAILRRLDTLQDHSAEIAEQEKVLSGHEENESHR